MAKSLGKGLSSLIPKKELAAKKNEPAVSPEADFERSIDPNILIQRYINKEIKLVVPADIKANPHQPRKRFDDGDLQDLVESIKLHGILQPLVATEAKDGKYELVAGERRLRAAKLARLKYVPLIVRSAGELEKLELSLIENIQRQDLNPIERAEAYKRLINDFSLTHEQAAKRMGKSRPVVSNALRILELPGEVQELIGSGKVSETHALALLELNNANKQIELAKQIARDNLSKDETRRIVKSSRLRSDKGRSFGAQGRQQDSIEAAYEQELSEKLNTRVKVSHKGKKWKIEIEAYSDEEMGGIVQKIAKS